MFASAFGGSMDKPANGGFFVVWWQGPGEGQT